MSLQSRLTALITAIGADMKKVTPGAWSALTMAGGGFTPVGCGTPGARLEKSDKVTFRGAYGGATYTGGSYSNANGGTFTPPATPLTTLPLALRPTSRRIVQGAGSGAMADLVTVVETSGAVWLTGNLDPTALYRLDGASFTL